MGCHLGPLSAAPGRDPSGLLRGLDECGEHSQGREWEHGALQAPWAAGPVGFGAVWGRALLGEQHFPALGLNLMHQTSLRVWKWSCEQDQQGRVRLEHHQPCAPCSSALEMASPLIPGILTVCDHQSAAIEPNPRPVAQGKTLWAREK